MNTGKPRFDLYGNELPINVIYNKQRYRITLREDGKTIKQKSCIDKDKMLAVVAKYVDDYQVNVRVEKETYTTFTSGRKRSKTVNSFEEALIDLEEMGVGVKYKSETRQYLNPKYPKWLRYTKKQYALRDGGDGVLDMIHSYIWSQEKQKIVFTISRCFGTLRTKEAAIAEVIRETNAYLRTSEEHKGLIYDA